MSRSIPRPRSRTALLPAFLLLLGLLLCGLLPLGFAPPAASQTVAPGCTAPKPVCEASKRVYAVSSFEPIGSAVLLEEGMLVTNRHVVADNDRAEVFLADGSRVFATVVPTSFDGDLVLLNAPGLGKGAERLKWGDAKKGAQVYAIGADVGRGAIRVYAPGHVRALPPEGLNRARLHHDAQSLPGNSGGALVDETGTLVAIIASGGEGRNEALPSRALDTLLQVSGSDQLAAHTRTGEAYRKCAEALDNATASRQRLAPKNVGFIVDQCRRTLNRQNYDSAGQLLGRQGFTDEALELFEASVAEDPNALNSRLSLAITLHTAGRYKDELPHLKTLVAALPNDPQVLRLAIQAGIWGGDPAFAEAAFKQLEAAHPRLAPVAKRFLDNPPPPRRPSPRAPARQAPAGQAPAGQAPPPARP